MTIESPATPVAPATQPGPSATSAPGPRIDDRSSETWTLLPVILQCNNVASNSNLNFTFTTAGVAWSLGARSGDSVGFSYNVATSSTNTESCIQSIEFNNTVLSIRTGESTQGDGQPTNTFTLTLFLLVHPDVDYLQGYCTINNEAVVLATFGAQSAVQWRNGRISAVLAQYGSNYRPVTLTVKGARTGNTIDVIVSTKKGLGKVTWSLGPNFADASGFALESPHGSLPLTSMSYGNDTLSFITMPVSGNSGNTDTPLDFYLNAHITWTPDDLNYIYLRTNSDSHITVIAQVHNRQPQVVSQTDTVFTL
jgi:hypothetical protein